MNQNPLLLATLFLKHQPGPKTFEQAVAMEVELIEKDRQVVESELTELANRDSALRMRIRELDFEKQTLMGSDPTVAEPPKPEKTPAPMLFQVSDQKRRDRKARLRIRKGTDLTERRYMNCKYVEMARKRGVGTVESNEIVWLTRDEHEPVYADVRADRSGVPPILLESEPEPAPVAELVWNRNSGRGHPQQVRTREGTGEVERSYSGHDYVGWARATGKGSPGIGCVYLTSEEADTAVKSRKPRESRQSVAAN